MLPREMCAAAPPRAPRARPEPRESGQPAPSSEGPNTAPQRAGRGGTALGGQHTARQQARPAHSHTQSQRSERDTHTRDTISQPRRARGEGTGGDARGSAQGGWNCNRFIFARHVCLCLLRLHGITPQQQMSTRLKRALLTQQVLALCDAEAAATLCRESRYARAYTPRA